MLLCWGENVGCRGQRLGCLCLIVGLTIVLVIVTLPRLSVLPRRISPSAVPPSTATEPSTRPASIPEVVHGTVATQWTRLATFYVLAGRKDVHNMSAQLATAAGDCRSLRTTSNASVCGVRADIYLLYADDDELRAAEAARNVTRYSPGVATNTIYRRINPQNVVREVNDVMLDAYLDGVDYFRLVLANGTSGTSLDSAHRLDQLSVRQHGVVAEMNSLSAALSAILFGSRHFDVFGWFLPLDLKDLDSSSRTVCDIYASRDMLRARRGGSDVTYVVRGNTSIDQHLSTLDRYMSALRNSSCWRCVSRDPEVKVISISLYGSGKRYTVGAVRNAQLLPVIFPGWHLWVHYELPQANRPTRYPAVPDAVLRRLKELGADLRPVSLSSSVNVAPMLWRFRVAVDPQVSVFTVRDADSRLTSRDAAVVSDWLRHPNASFHCIRDHPSHSNYAVSGGLWGGRPSQLAKLRVFGDMMGKYGAGYLQDMQFLCNDVWPQVQVHAYCHDSFSCDRYPASHAFPVARIGNEHLGEVYDEFSLGRAIDVDILLKAPVNIKCVP